MTTKFEKLPKSRIRFTITVPAETLERHYESAIKKVAAHVEIQGFRKGHAPRNLVIQKAGNASILNEMIELVLPDTYYKAVQEHKDIIPVSQPAVDVKELKGITEENLVPTEMTYIAETDVMPDVKLGDYKKIKVKPKKAAETVDKKELDEAVEEIKKMYGDDFMKSSGFENETDLRKAIEDNIKQQKIFQAQSDTYDMIIEEAIKKAKLEVPETFIHNEIHRMEQQVEAQAKAYGMSFDDWLTSQKKTHDDIHKEWHDQAEKAAKAGVVLGRIAEEEGIDTTKQDSSRLVVEKLYEYATGEKAPGSAEAK